MTAEIYDDSTSASKIQPVICYGITKVVNNAGCLAVWLLKQTGKVLSDLNRHIISIFESSSPRSYYNFNEHT